jgi:hypothetical protein
MLAGRLARLIGLPVPNPAIVEVPSELLPGIPFLSAANPVSPDSNLVRVSPGTPARRWFCSRMISGVSSPSIPTLISSSCENFRSGGFERQIDENGPQIEKHIRDMLEVRWRPSERTLEEYEVRIQPPAGLDEYALSVFRESVM